MTFIQKVFAKRNLLRIAPIYLVLMTMVGTVMLVLGMQVDKSSLVISGIVILCGNCFAAYTMGSRLSLTENQ